jgi:hypothetical protein
MASASVSTARVSSSSLARTSAGQAAALTSAPSAHLPTPLCQLDVRHPPLQSLLTFREWGWRQVPITGTDVDRGGLTGDPVGGCLMKVPLRRCPSEPGDGGSPRSTSLTS